MTIFIDTFMYFLQVFFYEDGIAGMIYGEHLSNIHYELPKNESLQLVKIQCFPLYYNFRGVP
jgi:hypothetical protein